MPLHIHRHIYIRTISTIYCLDKIVCIVQEKIVKLKPYGTWNILKWIILSFFFDFHFEFE